MFPPLPHQRNLRKILRFKTEDWIHQGLLKAVAPSEISEKVIVLCFYVYSLWTEKGTQKYSNFSFAKKLFAYLMPILKKANAYLYLIVQYMGD